MTQANAPIVGGKYNWIGQPERLVYLGRQGSWYQYAKVESPTEVWCEVQTYDLHRLESSEFTYDPDLRFANSIGLTPRMKELQRVQMQQHDRWLAERKKADDTEGGSCD